MNSSNSFEIEATQTPAYVSGQADLLAETNEASSSRTNEEEAPKTSSFSGIDTSVLRAVENGDTDTLQKYSNNLHQILSPTNNTVLHIYIANIITSPEEEAHKSTNIVKHIVLMCPSLLLQLNDNDDIALHIAARDGHAALVDVLIEAARDRREDPENDGIELVRRMLRTTNKEKATAMHEAARFGHLGVLRILTREDPDFTYSANGDGETPLYLAVERGHDDLVDEILKTCTHPAYGGRSGRTALHAAVICNSEGMTKKLLEHSKHTERAMTIAVDEQGWTPLHLAAFLGRLSIVLQLLADDKSAAYIGDKCDNMTPLHIAASKRHMHVIKELIYRCPDCCVLVDKKRRNVLHYVFKYSLYKVEDMVLKNKWVSSSILNGKDVNGNTPLHQLAVSRYWGEKFVSDARVDKLALNKNNMNAVDVIVAADSPLGVKETFKRMFKRHGAGPGHHQIKTDQESKEKGVQKRDDDRTTRMKDSNLVVATLIATVTFAAGFTVPGGYHSEKGPDQGFAVLVRNTAFQAFVITNSLAMVLSSTSVMICLFLSVIDMKSFSNSRPLLWSLFFTFYALHAMLIAFLTGTYAVLGQSAPELAITACILACVFYLYVWPLMIEDTTEITTLTEISLNVKRKMFLYSLITSYDFTTEPPASITGILAALFT